MTTPTITAQIPTSATLVQEYVLGGRSTFTVVSTKTQARYTYRVRVAPLRRRWDGESLEAYQARKLAHLAGPRLVEAMIGSDNTSDYVEIGNITPDGTFKPRNWVSERAEGRKQGFVWFWKAVTETTEKLQQAEIWHDGHCSCCGRKLTVPESLSIGLGPDCASWRYPTIRTHVGS